MKITHVLILAGALATSVPATADDNEESELSRCASISDKDKRLACFDMLNNSDSTEDAVSEITEDAVPEITEDFGAEQLDTDDANRKTAPRVLATITSCRKDAYNKYLLYLENGQVWKQKNNERLRLKECNFKAEIFRDGFGYKMEVEGGGWRMRVTRVR
jgi:hypothetical protein